MRTSIMAQRQLWLVAMLSVACLLYSNPTFAADISGDWFSDTGDAVINIIKAGPAYASSLPVTQGDVPAGSPHAEPGHFKNSITEFSASDTHVHFKVVETVFDADDHIMGDITTEYDLDLSPEGARLLGTQSTSIWGGDPTTKQVTLVRH